ncbi:MAG: hypothetical protein AAF940_02425 [Pseudomonadota bacterium]
MREPLISTILASLIISPAIAQEGRFLLERTENGYVRMDTQSGDLALCVEEDDQIICRAAADERAAFQQQIDALEDRMEALEQAMGAGITVLPDGNLEGLPSDEEFERGLDYMERFFDRFLGIIEQFDGSQEPGRL